MAGLKKKIARNTVANVLIKLWTYGISFLLLPFIVGHIGIENYGIWILVGSITGYFAFMDFGVGPALVKYVAEYNAKKDYSTINEMINSAFGFYLGIGATISISLLIVGTFFIDVFRMSPEAYPIARYIMYITAATVITSWPIISFSSIFAGLQRYDVSAKLAFASSCINVLVTVSVLSMGYGIVELVFVQIVTSSLFQIVPMLVLRSIVPYLEIRAKYMRFDRLKKIFRFSSALFVMQITSLIILQTDTLVLGIFASASAITFYAVSRKIYNIIQRGTNIFASALLPAGAEIEALNDTGAMNRLVFRGGKYRALLTLFLVVIVLVFATPIITIWMGAEFSFLGFYTKVFSTYWLLGAAYGVLGVPLLARERTRELVIVMVVQSMLNLTLSIILVQRYGILGVILGTVYSCFAVAPFWLPIEIHIVGIDFGEYAKKVLLPSYSIAGVSFACGLLLTYIVYPTGLLVL
ncbi:MAG: oligosaccharide flippase family protein, partial [Thermoplasmata archaeon]|nr:oligosaccharide flippase family protein [Thermoplasmata archaeon]